MTRKKFVTITVPAEKAESMRFFARQPKPVLRWFLDAHIPYLEAHPDTTYTAMMDALMPDCPEDVRPYIRPDWRERALAADAERREVQ
jgi:hypothetical protein